jgi:hypothetical protein
LILREKITAAQSLLGLKFLKLEIYIKNDKRLTLKQLGKRFNVCSGTILAVVRNKTWIDPNYNCDEIIYKDP